MLNQHNTNLSAEGRPLPSNSIVCDRLRTGGTLGTGARVGLGPYAGDREGNGDVCEATYEG
jgi:hypothetical protein